MRQRKELLVAMRFDLTCLVDSAMQEEESMSCHIKNVNTERHAEGHLRKGCAIPGHVCSDAAGGFGAR